MSFIASTTPLTNFTSNNFDYFWANYGDMIIWGAAAVLFFGLVFGILETIKQTWKANESMYGHHRNTRR